MTDKDFLKQLKTVKRELHKRMGKKVCKELDIDCFDCKTRILIGCINSWINILE